MRPSASRHVHGSPCRRHPSTSYHDRAIAPQTQWKPGELEARLVRHELPPETVATLATLRSGIEEQYGRLLESVVKIDPTLERTVESARNAALAGAQTIEKKLVASLKRLEGETLVRQIARARAAVYPAGQPQERVLTIASFLIRYGPDLVDALEQEVARWAGAS